MSIYLGLTNRSSAPAPRSDLVFSGFVEWRGALNVGVRQGKSKTDGPVLSAGIGFAAAGVSRVCAGFPECRLSRPSGFRFSRPPGVWVSAGLVFPGVALARLSGPGAVFRRRRPRALRRA